MEYTDSLLNWETDSVKIIFVNNKNNTLSEPLHVLQQEPAPSPVYTEMDTIDSEQEEVTHTIEYILSDNPVSDIAIMDDGILTEELVLEYISLHIAHSYQESLSTLISTYKREAEKEGVNFDVAIAQMLIETDMLTVQEIHQHYNFAKISNIHGEKLYSFPSLEIGVRAHIQHLKGYASSAPLEETIVDPRYILLKKYGLLGTAPYISGLSGYWNTKLNYATDILVTLKQIYTFVIDKYNL